MLEECAGSLETSDQMYPSPHTTSKELTRNIGQGDITSGSKETSRLEQKNTQLIEIVPGIGQEYGIKYEEFKSTTPEDMAFFGRRQEL